MPEACRFNFLAFHAGAQWAPTLFDHMRWEGNALGNKLFTNGLIIGVPTMPQEGVSNGGVASFGQTMLTSRIIWMYSGKCANQVSTSSGCSSRIL